MQAICTKCQRPFEAARQLDLSRPPICAGCLQQRAKPLEVNITERVNFDDRPPDDQPLKEREVRG
jgi:hypothetical protein